jgi:hypothetical protein
MRQARLFVGILFPQILIRATAGRHKHARAVRIAGDRVGKYRFDFGPALGRHASPTREA